MARLVGGPNDGETIPLPGKLATDAPIVLDLEDRIEGVQLSGTYECNEDTFRHDHRQYLLVDYEYTGPSE